MKCNLHMRHDPDKIHESVLLNKFRVLDSSIHSHKSEDKMSITLNYVHHLSLLYNIISLLPFSGTSVR